MEPGVYVFDKLATESSKGSKTGIGKIRDEPFFVHPRVILESSPILPFPASTFQVDLHVNQVKPPKETPQEKMADVMAIAEVTKEETPGDPETDRTSMMWMYSMCMVMSE